MSFEISMDTRGLDALLRQAPDIADDVALALAFEVEARAKIHAAVDTGFMKNNIDTEGPDIHGRGQAVVNSAADYSIYVELGTRNAAAQPFMAPAVAETEAHSVEVGQKILNKRLAGIT